MPRNKKPKQKPQQQKRKKTDARMCMSPACVAYCRTLADPFSYTSTGVPNFPTPPSMVFRAFAKGTFLATATGSLGYVAASPTTGMTSDLACVASSTTGFVGSAIAASGTGIDETTTNAPFADASYATDDTALKWRVVSAGLRVRYIGTELARGGRVYGYVDPDHQSLVGATAGTLRSRDGVSSLAPNANRWYELRWHPVTKDEMEYNPTPTSKHNMAVCFVPADYTNGALMEWEYVAHYEVIGRDARGKMPRVAAPEVDQVVSAASGVSPSFQTAANAARDTFRLVAQSVSDYRQGIPTPGAAAVGAATMIGGVAYANHLGQYARRLRHEL